MKNRIHIIGGGIGGLFTAALLAKEGYPVTVLERSAHVGGGLQSFTRNGVAFDAGMHVVGGLQPGGSLNRICRHLGILDQLHFRPVDAVCGDEVFCFEDGRTYRIPQGRAAFTEYFQHLFPDERENIQRYADDLFALADSVDFFFLRPGSGATSGDETFYQPSAQFIADHVQNPKLRSLLAYLSPLAGGEAGYTPAYIFALITLLIKDVRMLCWLPDNQNLFGERNADFYRHSPTWLPENHYTWHNDTYMLNLAFLGEYLIYLSDCLMHRQ